MNGKKIFCIIIYLAATACTKKIGKKPEASLPKTLSYTQDVKPFISLKCAISGCHISNFPFGDFNLYKDLKIRVDNGRINALVFGQKLMPPAGSAPLSDEELNTLKLWINDGAPEN